MAEPTDGQLEEAIEGVLLSIILLNFLLEILKNADLNVVTGKKVRRTLEDRFNIDLDDRKDRIDEMIMKYLQSRENKSKASGGNAKIMSVYFHVQMSLTLVIALALSKKPLLNAGRRRMTNMLVPFMQKRTG